MSDQLSTLHHFIVEQFDLEELRTLCFELGVRFDDLRGEGLTAKARELLLHLGRRGQLDRLLAALQQHRSELFMEAGLSTDPAALEALYAELGGAGRPVARLGGLRSARVLGALGLVALLLVVVALLVRGFLSGSDNTAEAAVAASIIGFQPQVEVKRHGTDRLIPAAFNLDLYSGDVVNTYAGAAANIICENGVLFNLPQQSNLTVDCRATDDPRIVARLDPVLGRLSVSPTVTFTLASDASRAPRAEQDRFPLVLSPRNTVITTTRPAFHWQPVPEARGYRLSLSLPGGAMWSRETTSARLSYPADAPPLEPGSTNIVTLATLDDETTADKSRLKLLSEPDQAALAGAEAEIRALDVDQTSRAYLLAQLYRGWAMWDAAITQLEQLTAAGVSSASLWQQLGDLYFEIGLYAQAEQGYASALAAAEAAGDQSAQAAAHLGLSRVAHAFEEVATAIDHLQTAEELYRQAGETEAAERVAAERARLEE
jgi:hypothetical protein